MVIIRLFGVIAIKIPNAVWESNGTAVEFTKDTQTKGLIQFGRLSMSFRTSKGCRKKFKQKKTLSISAKSFILLAPPDGLEPPT